jgi:predicted metal-dependent hydrolase
VSLRGEIEARANLIRAAVRVKPFRVRVVPKMKRVHGSCQRKGWGRNAYYELILSGDGGLDMATHTLCHEVAHVIAWKNSDHGPAWGRAFSACYRAAMGCR